MVRRCNFGCSSWSNVCLGVLMNATELEILSKQFDEAMDLIGKYELEVRHQKVEIEYWKEKFEKAMELQK